MLWNESDTNHRAVSVQQTLAKLNDVDLKREENVSLGPTDILKIALGIH